MHARGCKLHAVDYSPCCGALGREDKAREAASETWQQPAGAAAPLASAPAQASPASPLPPKPPGAKPQDDAKKGSVFTLGALHPGVQDCIC